MAVNVPIHSFINVKIGPLREPNQLIAVSGLPFRKPTRFPRLQLPARFAAFGLSDISSRSPLVGRMFRLGPGSPCRIIIFTSGPDHRYSRTKSARYLRMTALQQARRIALELARGGEPMNSAIIVTADDRQLFEVPLSENGS
jgi:hypothetical protein